MLSEKIQNALNDQINKEIYSSYLYMAMSMYFAAEDYDGASSWMRIQALEELTHAEKLMNFVNERDGRVALELIAKPKFDWDSAIEAFTDAYKHEQFISASIGELVNIAREERDYMSDNFLQWFVAEQVEEEAAAKEVLRMFKLVGNGGGGLLMIDKELASRVFTPPTSK